MKNSISLFICSINKLCILFPILLISTSLSGATKTWLGAVNSNYSHQANWLPFGVPDHLDDVVIPTNYGHSPVLSNTKTARSLSLENGATFTISSNGTLVIGHSATSTSDAISNSGTIHNNGLIEIGEDETVTGDGIENQGTFNNNSSGEIRIFYVEDFGIYVKSNEFNNEGLIVIEFSEKAGIANAGEFNNIAGSIDIETSNAQAINNQAGGEFNNLSNSEIKIGKDSENDVVLGILVFAANSHFINNNSTIKIDNTSGVGVFNKGIFDNVNGGIIEIGGDEENNDSYGIGTTGWLNSIPNTIATNDNSTIEIVQTGQSAIENTGHANFINQNGGILKIGQSGGSIQGNGILNNETEPVFTNDNAVIKIDNTDESGIHNGLDAEFFNLNGAVIQIGLTGGEKNIGEEGILNLDEAYFTNDSSNISIGHVSERGISNISIAEFNNLNGSTIEIGQQGKTIILDGIRNRNTGSTFTNNNSNIIIDNVDDDAILNSNGGTIENFNSGNILIGQNDGNIGRVGILNGILEADDQVDFINSNNSNIIIDETGIHVPQFASLFLQGSSTFNNFGNITIGNKGISSDYGVYSVNTLASLTNHSTGVITTKYEFRLAGTSTVINEGEIYCDAKYSVTHLSTNEGSGQYTVTKNFVRQGNFNPESSTFIFTGLSDSFIQGFDNTTFHNLQIDKSGSARLNLNSNINVNNELELVDGLLDLKGNNLTLDEANGTIIGETVANYIMSSSGGEIIKEMTLNNPQNENPGNIGLTITSSSNLGVTEIRRGMFSQDLNGSESIERYYTISPDNNSGLDATVRFNYWDHELNGNLENSLTAFRFNGTDWDQYEMSDNSTSENWVETDNVDAFSIWTLGESVILPVEILSFNAYKTDYGEVLLTWITTSEEDNDYFEVQRSNKGIHFSGIAKVKGQGSTNLIQTYEAIDDDPLFGKNYYRLKQFDYNGHYEYSDVKIVEMINRTANLSLFPNPSIGTINFNSQLNGQISVRDNFGNLVFYEKSDKRRNIDLSFLPSGTYILEHRDLDNNLTVAKFMIRN